MRAAVSFFYNMKTIYRYRTVKLQVLTVAVLNWPPIIFTEKSEKSRLLKNYYRLRYKMSGGSFGSRNDMISDKFNAVAKNQIFTEMVRREMKNVGKVGKFSINPNKMDYLPLKPTQLDPVALQKQLDAPAEDLKMDPELSKKIADSKKTPQEKNKWPVTSAQRLGWLWQEGVKEHEADARWNQSLSSCAETRYAKAYVMMSGKSPYAAN